MRSRAIARAFGQLLAATCLIYVVGLVAWATCRWIWGDRWWWLFALNVFAPYLFIPVVVVAGAAIGLRSRRLGVAATVALILGFVTVGQGFPLGVAKEAATGPELTVLTYNTFGVRACTMCVVETIRAAEADLVALQELTPVVADAIAREFAGEYPYQVLVPDPNFLGMGVISRFPLRATGETLPGEWLIVPQVLALDFEGQEVTVLNAHPLASTISPGPQMERSIRERDAQARTIADFVAARPGALIAPGDYNTTERNVAYDILSGPLRDAWHEAGRGPGHTFPSADDFQLSWLLRIDYIFHSAHWRATEARVLPWDGASDHRPLFARLVLRGTSGR